MSDFAEQWSRAESAVAAFIWSLVPHRHDADDLLQRTAEGLLARHGEYDPRRSFTAWAIGAARIEVLRFRQERGRDRHVFDEEAVDAVAAAFHQNETELAEARLTLQECVERLTARLRQVLKLHHHEGLSPREIASRLRLRPGAVVVSLHRARAALRECVERRS